MNRLLLTVTIATAAILGAQNGMAQTILYTPPGVETVQPVPLGAFIAGRVDNKHATKFRDWLAASTVTGAFDPSKGYTAFIVVDSAFDPSKPEHPIEHYIVNEHVGMKTMKNNSDTAKAINGDTLTLSRTKGSYYVDGKRVNGMTKNPEGTLYYIGGPVSAHL